MWREGWPLADSFTLLVYSWALDPGLWNKKTLCSSLNGIRHGLPKGPPWSLAWRVQTLSRKQSENVCEEMMDKYCYMCMAVCLRIFILGIWWIYLQSIYFMYIPCFVNMCHHWMCAYITSDCACVCICVCLNQIIPKGLVLKFKDVI